jgi:hypothetical protein
MNSHEAPEMAFSVTTYNILTGPAHEQYSNDLSVYEDGVNCDIPNY